MKLYLKELGIDEGKTPHSFRGGCAVTLAVSGFGSAQGIMDHVGWFSQDSMDRYTRLSKMAVKSSVGNLFKQVSDSPICARAMYENFGDAKALSLAF